MISRLGLDTPQPIALDDVVAYLAASLRAAELYGELRRRRARGHYLRRYYRALAGIRNACL